MSELLNAINQSLEGMSETEKFCVYYMLSRHFAEKLKGYTNSKVTELAKSVTNVVNDFDSLVSDISSEYTYPAIFTPEEEGMFSVRFPDLEGGYTCGENKEDAINSAKEVLALSLFGYLDDAECIPAPSQKHEVEYEAGEFVEEITINLKDYLFS